jgi:transposase InsO family protein
MKLTKKTLIETIRDMEEGKGAYQARKHANISVGRVYQIWNKYKKTGKIPELGKNIGRPQRPIILNEEKTIREVYQKYNVCASRLRKLIQRDYNLNLPHYHIHKIMLKIGFAKSNKRKDVRKKTWIRYERRHSLTAVHLDWGYDEKEERWFLPVIDDSSRKLLALIECESPTTDASIDAMKEALKHGEIQQCITDHGTQFWKGEDMKARFPAFLEQQGIKHIPTKIKHPQSNGKAEKFIHLYKVHRHKFKTKKEFIYWYNEIRPHMSLDEKTPEQAYQERKKQERKYFT